MHGHSCCRQLAKIQLTFVRAGTKHFTKSDRPARSCARKWQPQLCDGAGRGTGRLIDRRMGVTGAAAAFLYAEYLTTIVASLLLLLVWPTIRPGSPMWNEVRDT